MTMEDWKMKFKNRQAALQRYINESPVPVVKEGETKAEKARQFLAKHDKEPKGFLAWINHFLIWLRNPLGKLRNVAYAAEAVNVLSDFITVAESSQTNAQATSSSSQAPAVLPESTHISLNALRSKKKKLGYWSSVRAELMSLEKEVEAFQSETQIDWVSVSRDELSANPQSEKKPSPEIIKVGTKPVSPPLPTESSSPPAVTAVLPEGTIKATLPSIPDEIKTAEIPSNEAPEVNTRSAPLPRNSSSSATEIDMEGARGATSSTRTSSRTDTVSEERNGTAASSETKSSESAATVPIVKEWLERCKDRIEFLEKPLDKPITEAELKKRCDLDLKKMDELAEETGKFIKEKKNEGALSKDMMKHIISQLRSVSKKLQRKYHSDRNRDVNNATALSQAVNDDPLCKGHVLEELMTLQTGEIKQAALSEETKAYLASRSSNNISREEADENDFFENFFAEWEAQFQNQKQDIVDLWDKFLNAYRALCREIVEKCEELHEACVQVHKACVQVHKDCEAVEQSCAAVEQSCAAVDQECEETRRKMAAAEKRLEKIWGGARLEREELAQKIKQEIEAMEKPLEMIETTPQDQSSPLISQGQALSSNPNGLFPHLPLVASQEESEVAPPSLSTSNKPGLPKQ